MTEKNHARRVTVTRRTSAPEAAETSPARKAVAVRLRGSDSPHPVDVLAEEQTSPAAELPLTPDVDITIETPAEEQPSPADDTSATDGEASELPAACENTGEDTPAQIPAEEQSSPVDDTSATDGEASELPAACENTSEDTPAQIPAEEQPSPADDTSATDGEASELPAACDDIIENLPPEDFTRQAFAAVYDCEPTTDFFAEDTYQPPEPDACGNGKWYIPQKWKDISILRKLVMAASVLLALFSILPLFVGVISPGTLPPLLIAAFFFACALYWPLIDGCESTWGNVAIAVTAVCVMAGITYLAFVSGKMISASTNILREDRADVTVVVLGCKVNGDQPSRMLQARLETAAVFLLDHPQAHCIVSGGKGADEEFHEAFIMKKYLVDKGVSPMRIIMEDTSTSTLENINNSAALAEKYNCHDRFLIVTDRFHQYRAMSAANDLGIVCYALNVETVWYLAMPYWFREMAAITRDWLLY